MATSFSPLRQSAALERLLGARLAGIAVLTSEHDKTARSLLISSGVPSVFLDVDKPVKSSSAIQIDSMGGMISAVEHLVEFGHRKFFFCPQFARQRPGLLSHTLRDEGFAAAVRAYRRLGLTTNIVDANGSSADAGERAILSVIGQVPFTAVVAVTDVIAMGICHGLQASRLRIPEDCIGSRL